MLSQVICCAVPCPVGKSQTRHNHRVTDGFPDFQSNIVDKKSTEQSLTRPKLIFPVLSSALSNKGRGKKDHKVRIKWSVACSLLGGNQHLLSGSNDADYEYE